MYYLQNLALNPSVGFAGAMPPEHSPNVLPNIPLPSPVNGGPRTEANSSPPRSFIPAGRAVAVIRNPRRQVSTVARGFYDPVTWTAIFCVKLSSFLAFFRQLVDRLPPQWSCIEMALSSPLGSPTCIASRSRFFFLFFQVASLKPVSLLPMPHPDPRLIRCRAAECGHDSARALMLRLPKPVDISRYRDRCLQ